jgi:hypothetical protein
MDCDDALGISLLSAPSYFQYSMLYTRLPRNASPNTASAILDTLVAGVLMSDL